MAEYCDERVCFFVCLACLSARISQNYVSHLYQIFMHAILCVTTCLGPSLAAIRIITSGFVDDVIFAHNGPHVDTDVAE